MSGTDGGKRVQGEGRGLRVLTTTGTKLFAVCLLFSNAGCVIHFRS